jgi:phytoene dehydrogenase-like protein
VKELSRRELLALFLGAPVAAACQGRRAPELAFEGRIAGAADGLGHRLRAGFRPRPDTASRCAVLIVGGGIAGLSAGWRLSRAGLEDWRILELDDRPGGTARGGESPLGPHPWGAHYLPCPLPQARATVELLREMGAATLDADGRLAFDEAQLARAPQERLFVADRWYEGLFPRAGAEPEDLAQLARFQGEVARLAGLVDGRGRRAFAVPMAHGSDDAELAALDRLSFAAWLEERGFGSRRLRWYLDYACRDDYGLSLAGTSAWAGLHYFASRTATGGPDDLLTWPEGNARVVGWLARGAGRRLETGALALAVEPLPRGAAVLVFRPATGRAERIVADQVVLAVPRRLAARLLPHPRLAAEAREFRSGAWLVANLTLRRRPVSRGFPEAWDNVLHGSRSLGYVVATHQTDRHRPPGPSLWTWYLSLTDEDEGASHRWLEALSWREGAELVIADLRRAHPDVEACVERLDLWRWGHAMIRPRPGFVFGRVRREAARPLGDIHFAHCDLSGLPLLEEAQHHGIRAAEEILRARGYRSPSLL